MQAKSLSLTAARIEPAPLTDEPPRIAVSKPELLHDARNLIGGLSLYCSLLQRPGVLLEKHRHYADELCTLAERSAALLNRALAGDSTPPVHASQDVAIQPDPHKDGNTVGLRALTPVLRAVVGPNVELLISDRLSAKAVRFEQECLERIAVNLVRNAAEAVTRCHPVAGRVRVSLAERNSSFRLEVEDNGPGMSLAVASTFLHPPPKQSETPKGRGRAIVQELVRGTGGVLSIRVRPGRGTLFIVEWPPAGDDAGGATMMVTC